VYLCTGRPRRRSAPADPPDALCGRPGRSVTSVCRALAACLRAEPCSRLNLSFCDESVRCKRRRREEAVRFRDAALSRLLRRGRCACCSSHRYSWLRVAVCSAVFLFVLIAHAVLRGVPCWQRWGSRRRSRRRSLGNRSPREVPVLLELCFLLLLMLLASVCFCRAGLMITARNYLEVYPWDRWSDKNIPSKQLCVVCVFEGFRSDALSLPAQSSGKA
jgi:hypothetical protein